jgi:hypothetical protein
MPALLSGVATLTQLGNSLSGIPDNHHLNSELQSVSLSALFFGANTAASSSIIQLTGKTDFKVEAIPVPNYYGQSNLADRFHKVDPALGKVCSQIWEALFGTIADPERAAMYMLRQTWDHFFDRLAPDEDVRSSPFFTKKPGDKPNLVHREERLRYALNTQVKEENKRALLAAESKQMLALYQNLNRAHERGEVNVLKARQSLNSMFAYLEAWANALGI